MSKKVILWCLGIVCALLAFFLFLGATAPSEPETDMVLVPQFTAGERTFYCSQASQGEPECSLVASDTADGAAQDLGITLDPGSETTNVLLSPDKTHVLVVLAREAILIDVATLTKKTVATLDDSQAFGVYNEFPSFTARAKWSDTKSIELSVFAANTPDAFTSGDGTVIYEKPIRLSTKTVSI